MTTKQRTNYLKKLRRREVKLRAKANRCQRQGDTNQAHEIRSAAKSLTARATREENYLMSPKAVA